MRSIYVDKVLSRGLPKTGQSTSVVADDDGTYQKGWWLGRTVSNNRTRFIVKEFVTLELVVIDRATNLMWVKKISGVGNDNGDTKSFADAISWCEGLDFGGFSDWRLPNVFEMISLYNADEPDPSVYTSIFNDWVPGWNFWTSTRQLYQSDYYHMINFAQKLIVNVDYKAAVLHLLPVRSI